jgi:hypothetical protein
MTVTQELLVAALANVGPAAGTPDVAQAQSVARLDLGDPANRTQDGAHLGNPAALGGEFLDGIRDLLKRSEHINRLVGEDFARAQARIEAREARRVVGLPGAGAIASAGGAAGFMAGDPMMGMSGMASVLPPGPAARHPGAGDANASDLSNFGGDWEQVQDLYDRAFIRYTEFSAYQLQSAELNKITEQLSNAINTLVRAS